MKNFITDLIARRHQKFYQTSRFHLWTDIFLLAVIIVLAGMLVFLYSKQPTEVVVGEVQHQEKATTTTLAAEAEPALKLVLKADRMVIKDGESVAFKLDYSNNEDQDLENLSITFVSGNGAYSFDNLQFDRQDTFAANGKVLTAKGLSAGQEGELKLKARLKRLEPGVAQAARLSAKVVYESGGQKFNFTVVSSGVRILSNLTTKAAAYYYSPQGDQLGVGPLPPTVGIPTNYWIYWTAENSGNELNGLTMTARLPENVFWLDNKSLLAGTMSFDEATRQIVWSVDKVEANNLIAKARFEVGVIPESKDIGKQLNLLADIRFKARDMFCNSDLSGKLGNVSTELQFDRQAAGKGKVVEATLE